MDNGKVLITGGNEATQASDIYDPINNTWSTTSDSSIVHYYCHTSAKLFDGRVLITSGADSNGQFNTASQIYDPSDDSWQTIAQQAGICWSQIIPLNDSSDRLLIAGGWDPWTGDPITTWFYFDPHTNTFSAVKPLPANFEIFHSSALKDGSALLSGSDFYRFNPMNVNGEWSQVPFQPLMNEIRLGLAPLTLLPNGKVLMLVGVGELVGIEAQATRAFTFDPNETPGNEFKDLTTDPSIFGRIGGANTVLPDGKIFTVGGFRQSTDAIALGISGGADYSQVLDLENTTSIPWTKTATPTMISTHNAFISKTITLTNGKVLAIGDASSELYDPTSDTWSSYASHSPSISSDLFLGSGVTATLLKNGNVLVVGGTQSKIYNATSGTWTASGTLNVSRSGHSATLLENGEVLVASETTSELYDPVAGTWTNTTGNLTTNRSGHSATLMKNGKVMVISDNSAEIFDPSLGTWSSAGTLSIARPNHTATLLPNGKLIVVGGGQGNTGTYLATSEIYDPTTGTWSMNSHELVDGRSLHFATITKDGRLAIVGGFGIFGVLPFVEYLEY
jgi:N-acetylneuraminic acid mutarotase